jgi:hypothetical protein
MENLRLFHLNLKEAYETNYHKNKDRNSLPRELG